MGRCVDHALTHHRSPGGVRPMSQQRCRKCRHCRGLFRPDPRNLRHQRFCPKSPCRRASKAESQRRWLAKPDNRDYFRGPENLSGQYQRAIFVPARGLARVGAVACQRTSAVRVIRAALETCIAPRLGPNVSLAGEPRLVPKLQPAVARRGRPPARANSFPSKGVETTARLVRHQAVTMWTRPPVKLGAGSAHRAPSYRPCGQGVDKCTALDHPFPTLGALASTSSPPRRQSFMRKATSPPASASRTVPSSQEIRLRNNPVKSRGDSHELKRETTIGVQWVLGMCGSFLIGRLDE